MFYPSFLALLSGPDGQRMSHLTFQISTMAGSPRPPPTDHPRHLNILHLRQPGATASASPRADLLTRRWNQTDWVTSNSLFPTACFRLPQVTELLHLHVQVLLKQFSWCVYCHELSCTTDTQLERPLWSSAYMILHSVPFYSLSPMVIGLHHRQHSECYYSAVHHPFYGHTHDNFCF